MKRLGLVLALLLAAWPALAGELRPFVRGSWQELRQAHAGRPTVVHLWGLTCAPCIAELPQWGKLARERSDLQLVLVAADQRGEDAGPLGAALAKAGLADAESWGFADRFAARLRFEIDPRWQGELPRTLLIGADGEVTSVSGVADLAAVRAWLDAQKAKLASRE
jgi:thiol-disulfide isomerase/thioredoxin